MTTPLEQHNIEIQENLRSWDNKPLLRRIYTDFYTKIVGQLDRSLDGRILEIGCENLHPQPTPREYNGLDAFGQERLGQAARFFYRRAADA